MMLSFDEIVRKTQPELKKELVQTIRHLGYKPQVEEGYIYAKGSVPVMLVAHLDTVHRERVKSICYCGDRNIAMSPQGIGGDDRAGVYMILRIIKEQRCHVLFCEDEESGGVGASAFADSGETPDINYMVELDRCGSNDAVFYDCDNPVFTKFITGFGFKESMGSFSDISIIAPTLKVAAVNLSAGFYNEHTLHEYVDFSVVEQNIERVCSMVATPTEKFNYTPSAYSPSGIWHDLQDWYDEDFFSLDRYKAKTRQGKAQMQMLMPLPDFAYLKTPHDELLENNGQYLLGEHGEVYEYLHDFDVAVKKEGCDVHSDYGAEVEFDEGDAKWVEVTTIEQAFLQPL